VVLEVVGSELELHHDLLRGVEEPGQQLLLVQVQVLQLQSQPHTDARERRIKKRKRRGDEEKEIAREQTRGSETLFLP
jgi:hypothetical protein